MYSIQLLVFHHVSSWNSLGVNICLEMSELWNFPAQVGGQSTQYC